MVDDFVISYNSSLDKNDKSYAQEFAAVITEPLHTLHQRRDYFLQRDIAVRIVLQLQATISNISIRTIQ